MGSGRGWRRSPADGFWRRAGRRAASASPLDATFLGSASSFVGHNLETLKVRADFLRVASAGHRSGGPGLVVQAAPRRHEPSDATGIRVGFTASRKVGNAVIRNRVRRRLREVARLVIPGQARADLDYVLVGRQAALARDFAALRQELFEALKRLKALALATP